MTVNPTFSARLRIAAAHRRWTDVNDTPEAKEGFARLLEGPSGLIHVGLLPYHLTAAAKYPFTGRAHVGNQPA